MNWKKYGHTLLEMVMAILIFSIFLGAAFAVFSYGLKNWKLVEAKSDVQNQAEVAMGRIIGELTSTDITTVITGNSPVKYVVFETAVTSATGQTEKDEFGSLLWHGYVLYYTSPADSAKPTKRLLRKYIPHENRTTPKQINISNMSFYLTDTYAAGEDLRTVARNIYDLDISVNPNKYIVDISLVTKKNFYEKAPGGRLAYNKDFSENAAQETVNLKASIMPRNTQD